MYIRTVEIDNYRTFRHVVLQLEQSANYMVGDNNIGKSNFLDLLNQTSQGYGFRESDFLDPEKPVKVAFTLRDSESGEEAVIELSQTVREAVPALRNKATGERLPLEYIRRMYCIRHTLEEAPRNMLGSGEFEEIHRLFQTCLEGEEEVSEAVLEMGRLLGVDGPFSKDARAAALQLMYAIYGSDDESRYQRDNMQIMAAMGVHLMIRLMEKKESRAVPFEEIVTTDRKGKRYLPVLVCIDEPELHLHPYLQRAALSYCRRILSNQEPFFLEMVQKVLGIDGLEGQLFVVTHSTDALVNDYRRIIRLYRDKTGEVAAACGAAFHFDSEMEKHLIMHFPEVKEALYGKAAVLVEGETEYGAFHLFAATKHIYFDYYGICLINARGESSISKIAQLLRRFHIPSVSLYDRDVKGDRKEAPYIFYTDYICFEMDVVATCLARGQRVLLDRVVEDMADVRSGDILVSASLIRKAAAKLGLVKERYAPRKLGHISGRDRKKLEFYYFAWLYGNKGVIAGRALGMQMKEADIPPSFQRVIEGALRLAKAGEGK